MNIQLNGQPTRLDGPAQLLSVLHQQHLSLHHPKGFEELAWINNPRCPLVHLVEVDGQVVPLAVWANRPVSEGMKIATRSSQLDIVLRQRLTQLRERQQCQFIAQIQEFAAAEAESSGMVDLEKRAQWNFQPRGSSPSVFHDPNACVRCKACVDTCNDTQGVGALSFDEEQGVLFDDAKCTRCGQCILSCPIGFRKLPDFVSKMMGCTAPSRVRWGRCEVMIREAWHALKARRNTWSCSSQFIARDASSESSGLARDARAVRRVASAGLPAWDTNSRRPDDRGRRIRTHPSARQRRLFAPIHLLLTGLDSLLRDLLSN